MPRKTASNESPSLSLAEQAYQELKRRILTLQLRPGLFVNERELMELLDIGRMPVHQAVHRLQAEGLIEVIPRKGLVIRPDSLQDMLTLLEARLAMRIVNQSERMSFMKLDRAFHGLIAEAAGNQILADAQRPLHERSELIWHLRVMKEDGLVVNQREHTNILKAIIERDANATRKAMEEHLRSLHDRILAGSLER
jgi:DNA-binding GntR family transcriptional regulator